MADIELRRSLFGDRLVGEIEPALSWSDRRNLSAAAAGAMASVVELRDLNRGVASVERSLEAVSSGQQRVIWGLEAMAHGIDFAVRDLESRLGLRLEAQTAVLAQQRDLLAQIAETLRTPAKTRAAERIADTAELLRRGRFDRALANAEQAIEDDPNNPATFRSAAWALLGLQRSEEARAQFLESAAAADGDERGEALRQAARLAHVLDSPQAALGVLDNADDAMSEFGERAMRYDRALYLAEAGEELDAAAQLSLAFDGDERFALWALCDVVVQRHPALMRAARAHVDGLLTALQEHHRELDKLTEALMRYAGELRGIAAPPDNAESAAALAQQIDASVEGLREQLANLRRDRGSFAGALAELRRVVANARQKRDDVSRECGEHAAAQASWEDAERARREAERDEEVVRERATQRRALLQAKLAEVAASAGRGSKVYTSLDYTGRVSVSGGLRRRSGEWFVTVDEDLNVAVTENPSRP